MTNQNDVKLTAKELDQLGEKVARIEAYLRQINHTINLTPRPDELREGETQAYYHFVHEFLSDTFLTNQDVLKDLDEIAFALLNATDEHELNMNGYVTDEEGN